MKKRIHKTLLLTLTCFLFTCIPGTAFWSTRVQATAEESLLIFSSGSVPNAMPIQTETIEGVMIEIPLHANDLDGNTITFTIDKAPKKGVALIENDILVYTPADGKTGTDQFSYCALDPLGNCSEPAQVKVKIQKNKSELTYADMLQNPSHLAAIRLHESDIITGEKIGSSYFFHPNDTVTRGEFLAMAVAAGGYDLYHTDRTDFMDDDAISSWAKPYISTAACNGLVQGYRAVNGASEIRAGNFITLDEASSIICSLIKPYLDDPIAASVDTGSTHWAAAANTILDAVDILPSTHMKSGSEPITRQTACDLIYSALKIMQ